MKLGADPEVFTTRGGKIVPVCGYIPGTKQKPMPVKSGALQEDNVAAEFNINPASSKEEWVTNLFDVMAELHEYLNRYSMGYIIKASHVFDFTDLKNAGNQAFMFGCDPDLNAWTKQQQVFTRCSKMPALRTCGGHIHVEGGDDNTIRWMDVYLGLPSVLLDHDTDRRKLYGMPGSFRFKPYGVEYRTISNFWLRSRELMEWVWDATEAALNNKGVVMDNSAVYTAIAKGRKQLSRSLMQEYGVHAPSL